MADKHFIPVVGDGATVCHYSDSTACTIIRISASGKTIWIQEDIATLADDWKPEIIPGGFSGHCVNNHSQSYTYKPNPEGKVYRASLRKDGRIRTTSGERVTEGRYHFYDYNF